MYLKIQGGGRGKGVYANRGSCRNLIQYLQHEDKEREAQGRYVSPFFSSSGLNTDANSVIHDIDGNRSSLHLDDAKFFMLTVSPSKEEVMAMGKTDEQIAKTAVEYVSRVMDAYAGNFHHRQVHSGTDLLYFYKYHFTRGSSSDREFHIHVVVSRKDASGHYKLSPMTNHRSTSAGPVRGGFDRLCFDRQCELIFDEQFGFNRSLKKSIDYFATMKNGGYVEKLELEQRIDAFSSRKQDSHSSAKMSVADRIKQRKMDRFWNEYHTYYQPLFIQFANQYKIAMNLYNETWLKCGIVSKEISSCYSELSEHYETIRKYQKEIRAAKTIKTLIILNIGYLCGINLLAAALVYLLSQMVINLSVRKMVQERRDVFETIRDIYNQLQDWQRKREGFNIAKLRYTMEMAETMKRRGELSEKLNELREELKVADTQIRRTIWQSEKDVSLLTKRLTVQDGIFTLWERKWIFSQDGTRTQCWNRIENYRYAEYIGARNDCHLFRVKDMNGNEKVVNQSGYPANITQSKGMHI